MAKVALTENAFRNKVQKLLEEIDGVYEPDNDLVAALRRDLNMDTTLDLSSITIEVNADDLSIDGDYLDDFKDCFTYNDVYNKLRNMTGSLCIVDKDKNIVASTSLQNIEMECDVTNYH